MSPIMLKKYIVTVWRNIRRHGGQPWPTIAGRTAGDTRSLPPGAIPEPGPRNVIMLKDYLIKTWLNLRRHTGHSPHNVTTLAASPTSPTIHPAIARNPSQGASSC
jgi:hypothetical protein